MRGMKVLVISASRGIGLQFVSPYGATAAGVIAAALGEVGLARLRERRLAEPQPQH